MLEPAKHGGRADSFEESTPGPAPFPPHVPTIVEGVHAYTDRVSVAAGEIIRFHVSSSHPYELQLCRLGPDVDGPAKDQILRSFGTSTASVQPIHPGSYLIADKPLTPAQTLPALTLEVWNRRWRTIGRQAIIGQFDEPDHCGFGLFVEEDGSLAFYLGDGGEFAATNLHRTPPGQLHMEVDPNGLKSYPANTPSSVLSNRWHHVVAMFDGQGKHVWVDGRQVAGWSHSGASSPGAGALRIGAAGHEGSPPHSSTPTSPCRRSTAAPSRPTRSPRGSPTRVDPARLTRTSWHAGRSTRSGAIAQPTRVLIGATPGSSITRHG